MAYGFYRTLTIDKTKVPNTDQTNFPVLFSGTYSYLATVANGGKVQNSSGFDIIFTSDSQGVTKLDHEIESYTATTGACVFWVRVPTVSTSADTVIYLWYGNSAISSSQENITGVWDSNFKGVYHLPNGTTLTANDSTANPLNGTLVGDTAALAGKINGAATFDGTGDRIDLSTSADGTKLDAGAEAEWTIEAWINSTNVTAEHKVLSWWDDAGSPNGYEYLLTVNSSGQPSSVFKNSLPEYPTQTSPDAISTNIWYHLVATYIKNTTGGATLYVNGVLKASNNTGNYNIFAANNTYVSIGTGFNSAPTMANPWIGGIDEVRFSNLRRSADWIATEYNNHNSPSTFYTIGNESSPSLIFQPIIPFIPMLVR